MAHLSLYRQYRPDSFDKMVRQEHVVRVLKNQIEKKTVGHAYLFTGPRGTGKTSVARIFARAVNCEKPENGSPCGTCKVCRALLDGSLVDGQSLQRAFKNTRRAAAARDVYFSDDGTAKTSCDHFVPLYETRF